MRIKQTQAMEYAIREPQDPYLLDSETKVWGQGSAAYDLRLCLVGEAPSATDEREEKPFTGREGDLVRKAMAVGGTSWLRVWITNAINERPNRAGKLNTEEAKEALKAQKKEFWEEMKHVVKERGVKTFMALGDVAMQMFNIPGRINTMRGSVIPMSLNWEGPVTDREFEEIDFFVIPAYSPGYVLKHGFYQRKEASVSVFHIWYSDFKKAGKIAKEGYSVPLEKFVTDPDAPTVAAFVEKSIQSKALVALDLETDGLDPSYSNIVTIGLALNAEEGISIRLRDGSYKLHHSEKDTRLIENDIQRLLLECEGLILQNAKYDLKWLIQKNFKIDWSKLTHDIMILHHTINPEQPHNLGFISSIYGDTVYWKENTNWEEGSIYDRDPRELAEYNIRDCVVLHQILPNLLKDLEELGPETEDLYHNEAMPLIQSITQMEINGVPWDETTRKKIKTRLEEEIPRLEQEMREIAGVCEDFEFKASHLALLLYGIEHASLLKAQEELPRKKPGTKIHAEMTAKVNVLNTTVRRIWDYSDAFFQHEVTDSKAPATHDKARTKLATAAIRRKEILSNQRDTPRKEAELRDTERLLAFLGAYTRHAALSKLLETYVPYKAGKDGRIHANWKQHGTNTGRLACSGPNLMNIPKPDDEDEEDLGGEFRACIKAPPGFKIVTPDYSNLEVGTVAYESQEPNLIEIFEKGLNQHDINTRILFGIDKDNHHWKSARKAAKVFQFGALNYAGGENTVYSSMVEIAPELGLTRDTYRKAYANYMAANPVYASWKEQKQSEGVRNRIVRNAFGRVRVFYGPEYNVKKEALNFPCQSAAASIINRATNRISARLNSDSEFSKVELIMQIHDQLVFIVPDEVVESFCVYLKEEMETPVQFYGKMRRFPVDIEIGQDLKNLTTWEPKEAS
jgi:uracil-DNA glycosylase family 4